MELSQILTVHDAYIRSRQRGLFINRGYVYSRESGERVGIPFWWPTSVSHGCSCSAGADNGRKKLSKVLMLTCGSRCHHGGLS